VSKFYTVRNRHSHFFDEKPIDQIQYHPAFPQYEYNTYNLPCSSHVDSLPDLPFVIPTHQRPDFADVGPPGFGVCGALLSPVLVNPRAAWESETEVR
jgi:hypothetical protein